MLEAVERMWIVGLQLLRREGRRATARPATAPSELEIVPRGLAKQYGSRTVVSGVDLSFSSERIVGLLGPNGAGKTTILHMVIGLIPLTAGRVILNGVDITDLPMYQRARAGVPSTRRTCC